MATSTTGTNRKKLLLPTTMSKAGWALVEARDDVEGVSFVPTVPKAELHRLLEDVAGVALGVQPFSDPELDAAPELEVVSRIGVGYDAVDVPALTRRKIPLMIGGTANSVSVAEAGVFLIMSLARRGAAMDRLVKEGRWQDRYKEMPVDLYGKTVLIIGFGKIGTRSAKRFAAMETHVLIYDRICIRRRSAGWATSRCRTSTPRWRAPISSRSIARKRPRRRASSTPRGSRI